MRNRLHLFGSIDFDLWQHYQSILGEKKNKCVKTIIFLFEPGSYSVLDQVTGLNILHTSQDFWAQYDKNDLWDRTESRQNHGWYLICNICFIKEQLLLIILFSVEYFSHISRNVWCNPNDCLIHYLYMYIIHAWAVSFWGLTFTLSPSWRRVVIGRHGTFRCQRTGIAG